MKHIATFLFLLIGFSVFAQVDTLKQPATIGQDNRNQRTGRGLQIGRPQLPEVDSCIIYGKLFIPANAGAGKVLTSNGIGLATWQAPSGGGIAVSDSAWMLTGNSGTNPAVNFIGTIDNVPLVFRTKNQYSGVIDPINGNTVFGKEAYNYTVAGMGNTAVGAATLGNLTSSANNNTAIGFNIGQLLTTGNNNTLIGVDTDTDNDTANNAIALGYQANAATNQFAIGDSIENLKFRLNGQTNGYVLTTNGTTANWQPPSSIAVRDSAWMKLGNAGTNSGINFIGTTDTAGLTFKFNNHIAGSLNGFNTAFGDLALAVTQIRTDDTGSVNTAIGTGALAANRYGSVNTAIGQGALALLKNGTHNISLGSGNSTVDTNSHWSLTLGNNIIGEDSTIAFADEYQKVHMELNGQVNGYVLMTDGSDAYWQPASCGSCDLQAVTDNGDTTNNAITVSGQSGSSFIARYNYSPGIYGYEIQDANTGDFIGGISRSFGVASGVILMGDSFSGLETNQGSYLHIDDDDDHFEINGIGKIVPLSDTVIDIGSAAKRWKKIYSDSLKLTAGAQNGYVLTSDANGNATWQASAGGGVTSVSGTTNRITSTGGSTPVIDIAATYVGQASITTLGTVGTGTWQATPVVTTYGGTGLSSYTQGDLLYYDAGTVLSKLAKNDTASRYLSNTGTNNNPAWAQIDLANGVTGVLPAANGGSGAWVDYTATSTVTGWSSFTTKTIRYQEGYKRIYVMFDLVGTSDATTASFTLPFSVGASAARVLFNNLGVNNGNGATKLYVQAVGSSTLTVSNSPTTSGVAWTASGTKAIVGQYFFEID